MDIRVETPIEKDRHMQRGKKEKDRERERQTTKKNGIWHSFANRNQFCLTLFTCQSCHSRCIIVVAGISCCYRLLIIPAPAPVRFALWPFGRAFANYAKLHMQVLMPVMKSRSEEHAAAAAAAADWLQSQCKAITHTQRWPDL